ncbi:LysM peptidoglycan-binding domain-containing protein [Cellulomonas sp. URHD0024]|uniref:LysM peptidoglycan-binding domain-containing protein n=1 Tax=Cellulomonas sp. URHD0024 TaxID=1302620 RepID=UPI0003FBFACB|nr:LysM peptidoglycan-binding domain-containing protein [Cellulomonas sp. URHD0024]
MTTMAMAPTLPKVTSSTGRPATRSSRTDVPRLSDLSLTGRGRLVLWFLALVLVAGAVLGAGRAAADSPLPAQQVEQHVVQKGETMWQIASTIADPGQDVRDVVVELVRLNELPGSGLMAGQVIVVPRV